MAESMSFLFVVAGTRLSEEVVLDSMVSASSGVAKLDT